MPIPPGIPFLLGALPKLLAPSALAYVILELVASQFFNVSFSSWVKGVAYVLALPAWLYFSRVTKELADRRRAAAIGVPLPPPVKDPGPFGFKTYQKLKKDATGYPAAAVMAIRKEHGPTFRLEVLGDKRVFTDDPQHIQAILATQFDSFEKGPEFIEQFKSLLGVGVFDSDGEMWKFHRSATRPYFSRDRIAHFDNFDQHSGLAISLAKDRLSEGHAIDFQDLVARFTLDSATTFLFGMDVKSLSAGLAYSPRVNIANPDKFINHPSNTFVTAFTAGQWIAADRGRKGALWPVFEITRDKVKPHREVINKYINDILQQVLQKRAEKPTDPEAKGEDDSTLLEHLVDFTQDPEVLLDEINNLLVAGRDTTASLLSFGVYVLTQRPEIVEKLRQEILSVVSNRRPLPDDIKNMKYLRAFLNETLRLYPAVPFNVRSSNQDTVWKSKVSGMPDYFIPAHTRVVYSVLLMHRRQDLWGPDAEEFDPERFLDDRLKRYLTPNPFAFLPFNAGPRICLGQQFAYNEASYFLIKLLQSFTSFSLAEDAQPSDSKPPEDWKHEPGLQGKDKIWPSAHLTMFIKGGLWIRMEPVKSD